MLDSLFCNICKMKNQKLKKLLQKGDELLNEELDITKIIKSLRISNKDQENKFEIDMDEREADSNIKSIQKTQIIS